MEHEKGIDSHTEAMAYLHDTLDEYLKYHPNITTGTGHTEEWLFNNTLKRRIERRKDLREMSESINITGDGNVIGHNNHVNVDKTAISSGASLSEFTDLLAQMHSALETQNVDPKTARIIKSDLEILEGEIAEENPDNSIIQAKLASIAAIAENAATIATSGGILLPLIYEAVKMAPQLFR